MIIIYMFPVAFKELSERRMGPFTKQIRKGDLMETGW